MFIICVLIIDRLSSCAIKFCLPTCRESSSSYRDSHANIKYYVCLFSVYKNTAKVSSSRVGKIHTYMPLLNREGKDLMVLELRQMPVLGFRVAQSQDSSM